MPGKGRERERQKREEKFSVRFALPGEKTSIRDYAGLFRHFEHKPGRLLPANYNVNNKSSQVIGYSDVIGRSLISDYCVIPIII